MLRSAQRLKRFNASLSLQSIQAPLSTTNFDYSIRGKSQGANHRESPRWTFPATHFVSHRCFSTTQCDQGSSEETPSNPFSEDAQNAAFTPSTTTTTTFDDTMEKIFTATQQQMLDADTAEAAASAAREAGLIWEPSMWRLTDIAVESIRYVHDTIGLEYGWSIIAVTVALRLMIFPVVAYVQINQSRMAHAMPELNALNEKWKTIRAPTRDDQIRHGKEMNAIFKKYGANPVRAFWLPVIQLPAFLGLFFGLQKMTKYPVFADDMAVGGMLWFTNLTIPDPYFILPLTSALSFLAIIELTQKKNEGGLTESTQKTMTLAMRGLALVMIPISLTFPSAVVAYWTTNNLFTFAQLAVLGYKPVKKALDIWDPPKGVPGKKGEDLVKTIQNLFAPKPTSEQLIKKHNDRIISQQKMKELSKQALFVRKGGRTRGRKVNTPSK